VPLAKERFELRNRTSSRFQERMLQCRRSCSHSLLQKAQGWGNLLVGERRIGGTVTEHKMITDIKFKFGKGPGAKPETVKLTPVTVFVGPNNSGKSRVLSEIRRYCGSEERSPAMDVILDRLAFAAVSQEDVENAIRRFTLPTPPNQPLQMGEILYGKPGGRNYRVYRTDLADQIRNATDPFFSWYYLEPNTLMLDGPNRINLINPQGAGDMLARPLTSFQVLLREDAKRAEVRRILFEAFGLYFVLDPTLLGSLRIKLSLREPATDMEERGIHEAAVSFHAGALPIENTSDGVKAFTGMITEIVAGDPAILLIDEPEAFLHPALAFLLGKEIARLSSGSRKNLFVSTHSADFVMGCIQSGAHVNIIRLTYRSGVATVRVLRNDEILQLMRNPLLRSVGVLRGLFYESVVVAESDTDRAFYQEINERLLRLAPDAGIPNCLFLNAQNKQTVQTIIRPLRDLGIPAAAIVDVDVLKEGGNVWSGFLEGGFVPQIERHALAISRSEVKLKFDATGKDMKRDGGIDILAPGDKEAAKNLFERLSEYGLFVVPRGEIESWLPALGAQGHGPTWLVDIFEKMGEDPESPAYVRPGSADVWEFLTGMKRWLTNPNRKGIPN
jgi:predicted ATPase